MRILKGLALGLGLALATFVADAAAQSYPTKTAKFVVGFQPGGTVDIVARLLAERLTQTLGQTFIVENRAGATQMIAAEHVARSEPDGHTIFICSSGAITMNPTLFKDIKYLPERDFAPVTAVIETPLILMVNPANPATANVNTVQDFVALAKARQGRATYGTAGNGNLTHVGFEALADTAGVKMVAVHYQGGAPSHTALMAKEIFAILATPVSMPQIRSGELRAVAVSSLQRYPALADVPSIAESGFPGFNITFWTGIFVPKATPKHVVDTLNRAIAEAVQVPGIREKLVAQGVIAVQSPSDFADKIAAETRMLATVATKAGIKVD